MTGRYEGRYFTLVVLSWGVKREKRNKRMKTHLLILFFVWSCSSLFAQIRIEGYRQVDIHPRWLEGRWDARWISVPDEPANTYGVYHFRKTVELDTLPERFIVHVTADNRYKLYANGHFVSLGPARGDVYNWYYDTVDLSPYLRQGKNTLAAVVWNYADQKPAAQISFGRTGFLLQGNTVLEAIVNTDDSWLCMKDEAYSVWNRPVFGYYVAGPGEQLLAEYYPWGWEQPNYDDKHWRKASLGMEGAAKGARDYAGRLLVPRLIPPMEMRLERFKTVCLAEGITVSDDFLNQKESLVVPAHSHVRLLLDKGQLTTGYFSLLFSKGNAAEITVGYAESLYENERETRAAGYAYMKGNREEVKGKRFVGYEDRLIADGGENRQFTTLWWRTWRYVLLDIKTVGEPLRLDGVYGTFTAYPFLRESQFVVPGRNDLDEILDIGWRTARLCANETYMDCPYYEQLQYWGDTRVQAMITMYNTRDSFMVRQALELGRLSLMADGLTMSRYPSDPHQFISSFSLWWIGMGYDYWMYRGDEAYLKTLLPVYRNILSWYEQWLKPDGSLANVPYWFFADWADGFDNGEPIREKDGNSAFQDLLYLLTLDEVAEMEQAFGMSEMATHYKQIASIVRINIRSKYWVSSRGLFADTDMHRSFSQHVNALAVLAHVVEGKEAENVITKILDDGSLIQATIFFRYYLNWSLKEAGLGDNLLDNLQVWRDQMALGLTTWAESPEPSRSDCHAWSSSPNIEFFRTILGIESQMPGFKQVRVAPSLGELKDVSGKIPHPAGFVSVSYQVIGEQLKAEITLPDLTEGVFVWKGKEYPLSTGRQVFLIK